MRAVLLFHPGLLVCLLLLSLALPFGTTLAVAVAVLLVLGYAYLVLVPLRLSRFTESRRRLSTTLGLLVSLIVTLALFILVMERWDARVVVRYPVAFGASYYAGAAVTTVVLLGSPRGRATRP